MSFHSQSPEQTAQLASLLADCLDDEGLVVALCGDLGAGKTAFVKGLAAGLGVDPDLVSSPTYVIVHEYPAPGPGQPGLAHVDFYRVESSGELEGLGFDDLLRFGAIVAVEWADRFDEALPPDHLALRLERAGEGAGETQRVLRVEATGPNAMRVVSEWQELAQDAGIALQNPSETSCSATSP